VAACLAFGSLAVHAQHTVPAPAAAPAVPAAEGGSAPDGELLAAAPQKVEITGLREGRGYDVRATGSATRLDLSLRETPQSVSVMTRQLIDDLGAFSVQNLLDHATGVRVERVETDRSYFTARGFDVSNFQLDGIGLPFATGDQLGDIDTALYERVEILRGANGLMSATGNPSATVNFIRKRPGVDLRAQAAFTYGSWDRKRLDVDLSSPISSDGRVRGRVIAAAEQGGSYLDRYSVSKQVLGAIVDAQLTQDTLLTVGLSRQDNRPNGTMWGALPLIDSNGQQRHFARSASTAPDWAYWNTLDDQAFVELTHTLGNGWQLKGVLTRRRLSSDSELFYVYGATDPATGEGLFGWPSKYHHTEHQTQADLSASGKFWLAGREHQVVLGVNTSRSRNALRSSDDQAGGPITEADVLAGRAPRPAFDEGITGQADFTDRRSSLFGVVRWSLQDRLSLITGVNLTRATSDGQQYGEPHRYQRTKALPYLGAVWDLDEQHSVYLSHAGIFNPQNKTDAHEQVLPAVEGRNTELGLKGEWLDGQLNGSVAVFRAQQDNTAGPGIFDPATGRTHYEPQDATSTGFELDLAGTIAPGWDVAAGYTQLRLKGGDGQDVRTHVPRRTASLATSVRLPVWPALKLGGAVRWQDDIHSGVLVQKAYAVADLMASYDINRQLTVAAHLRNVGNTQALTSLQWSQAYAISPRNGSVTLQWRY
jgi:outer membrane receptor for ferric coprogen and ferric-rhodotorulic acid